MTFELMVGNHTPLTPVKDLNAVAAAFLRQIGYLPKEGAGPVEETVPFRMFTDCFLMRPDKQWTVEELIAVLGTTRPTMYRHLNKLKSLDILEEASLKTPEDQTKKTYRLRYGNLSKAWTFVEANIQVAMENYRRSVDHLQELAGESRRADATATLRAERGTSV